MKSQEKPTYHERGKSLPLTLVVSEQKEKQKQQGSVATIFHRTLAYPCAFLFLVLFEVQLRWKKEIILQIRYLQRKVRSKIDRAIDLLAYGWREPGNLN